MIPPSARAAALLVCALAPLAACDATRCGPGTERKQDPATGELVCTAPAATSVPCDVDGGARVVGGVCQGDPDRFPRCGAGTKLDPQSGACVPEASSRVLPPPCPAPTAGTFCVNGVVRSLRDLASTAGKPLEVRAYDPIGFLADPANAKPLAITTTDARGTYVLPALTDTSGAGLIAIAVIDPERPAGAGGAHDYALAGSGQDRIEAGRSYQVDLYAVEKSLVSGWETSAGLAAGSLLGRGVYLARFLDAARPAGGIPDDAPPAAAVTLTFDGAPATGALAFRGDLATLSSAASDTDAKTGAVLRPVAAGELGTYSGTGAARTWESFLGGSTTGVVFIQTFFTK